jgi:hypothetical protein
MVRMWPAATRGGPLIHSENVSLVPKQGVWMVCFCAADLLWATRIKSTADALGIPCRPTRNVEMLEARLVDSPVRSLIVDLESADAGMPLIRRLRDQAADERARAIRIVAFGPHVAVERFQEAKRAGADAVMARGAFNARLPEILKQLAAAPTTVQDDLHEET